MHNHNSKLWDFCEFKNNSMFIIGKEDNKTEFKKTYWPEFRKTWRKYLVAFANTDGGVILFGVNDSGKICGTINSGFDQISLDFDSMGADIDPPIHPQVVFDYIGKMTVIRVFVSKSDFKHVDPKGDSYIRLNASIYNNDKRKTVMQQVCSLNKELRVMQLNYKNLEKENMKSFKKIEKSRSKLNKVSSEVEKFDIYMKIIEAKNWHESHKTSGGVNFQTF